MNVYSTAIYVKIEDSPPETLFFIFVVRPDRTDIIDALERRLQEHPWTLNNSCEKVAEAFREVARNCSIPRPFSKFDEQWQGGVETYGSSESMLGTISIRRQPVIQNF